MCMSILCSVHPFLKDDDIDFKIKTSDFIEIMDITCMDDSCYSSDIQDINGDFFEGILQHLKEHHSDLFEKEDESK